MEIISRIEIENIDRSKLKEAVMEAIQRIETKYPKEKINKIKFEVILTDQKIIVKETDEVFMNG